MGKRKFITVTRVANTLYWKCVGRGCDKYYSMVESGELPRTIFCQCGCNYSILQVSSTTQHTARILIEVKE